MTDDELRASHEDRDRVVEVLRVAAGDGRLSAEELDERVERALNARTYGELSGLVDDLPGAEAGMAAAAKPKDLLRIDRHGASARQAGRWTVPKRAEVKVTGGNVTLDFTEAIIALPSLQVGVSLKGGNLTLITRPGIVVDTDEVVLVGGDVKVREHPDARASVLLRVEVAGKVVGGNIIVRPPRPPRRTFWQWLRRERPRAAITARLAVLIRPLAADDLAGGAVAGVRGRRGPGELLDHPGDVEGGDVGPQVPIPVGAVDDGLVKAAPLAAELPHLRSGARRGNGRPGYDHAKVLRQAIELFIRQGYDAQLAVRARAAKGAKLPGTPASAWPGTPVPRPRGRRSG